MDSVVLKHAINIKHMFIKASFGFWTERDRFAFVLVLWWC